MQRESERSKVTFTIVELIVLVMESMYTSIQV